MPTIPPSRHQSLAGVEHLVPGPTITPGLSNDAGTQDREGVAESSIIHYPGGSIRRPTDLNTNQGRQPDQPSINRVSSDSDQYNIVSGQGSAFGGIGHQITIHNHPRWSPQDSLTGSSQSGTNSVANYCCESAADTYARILLTKRIGYPLWSPEPLSISSESGYETEGIRIGDVGVVDGDGQFSFFFNVCLPLEDPINCRAPPSLKPLTFGPNDLKQKDSVFTPNTVIESELIQEQRTYMQTEYQGRPRRLCQFQLDCLPPEGAVLVLPNGASRTNLQLRLRFQEYACQNIMGWYNHAYHTLHLEPEAGPLYLITGYDKCDNWCIASYRNIPTEIRPSLSFKPELTENGAIQYSSESSGAITAHAFTPKSVIRSNQCIFIRGYKMTLRKSLIRRILVGPVSISDIVPSNTEHSFGGESTGVSGGSTDSQLLSRFIGGYWGPSTNQPQDKEYPNVDAVAIESFPDSSEPYHPSNVINSHLLAENPGAWAAITHDDLWCDVMQENESVIPDGHEFMKRILKKYRTQLRNGCVSFLPIEKGSVRHFVHEASIKLSEYARVKELVTTLKNSPASKIPLLLKSKTPLGFRPEMQPHGQDLRSQPRNVPQNSDIYHGNTEGSNVGGNNSVNVVHNVHIHYHPPANDPKNDYEPNSSSQSPGASASSPDTRHQPRGNSVSENDIDSSKPTIEPTNRSVRQKRPNTAPEGKQSGLRARLPFLKKSASIASTKESLQEHVFTPPPIPENSEPPAAPSMLESHEDSRARPARRRTFLHKLTRSKTHPIPTGRAPDSHAQTPSLESIPATVESDNFDTVAMAADLEQAVNDPYPVVYPPNGPLQGGTLMGLVDRLISDFPDVRENAEYRDTFLATYVAFTTADKIYRLLVNAYYKVESFPLETQAMVRYNIVVVMRHWVDAPHVLVDMDVLLQMKEFAVSLAASGPMAELANKVTKRIDIRINAENSEFVHNLPPGKEDITPLDVANAMTILEGELYGSLFPADYIRHHLDPSSSANITAVMATNKQIFTWVKMSVLIPENYVHRAEVFRFFINTALECRRLGNFSSMVAIVKALQSPAISRLTVKNAGLMKHLDTLAKLIKHVPNHRPYQSALYTSRNSCVPWIEVHLLDLENVLRKHKPAIKINGRPLINFVRLIEITNWIKSLLKYKPPRLKRDDYARPLAYLESQLRDVSTDPSNEDSLEKRSQNFPQAEKRIHDNRIREVHSLGLL